MGTTDLGDPLQIALVARDAQASARMLSRLLGVGPWSFEDWPPADRPKFESYADGRAARWRVQLACASWGNIELELIQPVEGENHYTRTLARQGDGIHHLLFEVDDLDAAVGGLAEQGHQVVMGATSRLPGARWVLVDTTGTLGFALEIRSRPSAGQGRPGA